MKLKIICLVMVFLMIGSIFAYAETFNPIQSVESGLEKTKEALSNYENTDIIINVDSYYPTVLSEQAFESDEPGGYSLWATLRGYKTNPLMDIQKINNINVKVVGGSTKHVSNAYFKKSNKGYLDLSNLGYVTIKLRKLKEDDVPKRLDINMTAYITYEIKNGFGANEQDLILPLLNEEEFLNKKSEFSFFGGRGYIRLANIKDNYADLIVYDGMLNKNQLRIKEGSPPSENRYLSGGVPYLLYKDEDDIIGRNLRNAYRVRVNQIIGNKDKAKMEVLFNGEYKIKEFVEGQYLYSGSRWKIKDIIFSQDAYEVEIFNEETKESLSLRMNKLGSPAQEDYETSDSKEKASSNKIDESKFSRHLEFEGFGDIILNLSKKENIDPLLVAAVIKQESNFNEKAISPCGAVGLMQLMPDAARNVGLNVIKYNTIKKEDRKRAEKNCAVVYACRYGYSHSDKNNQCATLTRDDERFNPNRNIEGGIKHLKEKLTRYDNDLRLSLAAYNGGDKANEDSTKCPGKKAWECEKNEGYKETREYVRIISIYYQEYQNRFQNINSIQVQEQQKPEQDKNNEESIRKEYNNLRTKEKNKENINSLLEEYLKFLDKINDLEDAELLDKYKILIIKDLTDLEDSYRENKDISDKIRLALVRISTKPKISEKETKDTPLKGSYQDYLEKAIESYSEVSQNKGVVYEGEDLAMKSQLRIAEIYDYYLRNNEKAIEEYSKLISEFDYPEKNTIENRIKFLTINRGYLRSNTLNIFENENSIALTLFDVNRANEESNVIISIDGIPKEYSLEENKDKLGDSGWLLKDIKENYVMISKFEKNERTGRNEEVESKVLNLNKEENIRISSEKRYRFLLEKINIKQEAHITILPGEEKITTQSNFMLHIPIEPRLWKLSTEQINDHINVSRKIVDGLNKAIGVVENIYKYWSLSCYGTFAALWLKNTWFSGGAKNIARKEVTKEWRSDCESPEKKKEYGGNIFECIKGQKQKIEEDIEKYKNSISGLNNEDDIVLKLAKENFNNERLNNRFDEEALDIEYKKIISTDAKGDKTLEKIINNSKNFVEKENIDSLKQKGISEEIINKRVDYIKKSLGLEENNQEKKPTKDQLTSLELGREISTSYFKDGYVFVNEIPSRVYNKEAAPIKIQTPGETYYVLNVNTGKYEKITFVDKDVSNEPKKQQEFTTLDSGKFKGKVDRISIDSLYYLRVPDSGRGGDGNIIKVELWGRIPKYGETLDLDSSSAERIRGSFNLNDCISGSSSDRELVDQISSLKIEYPKIQEACRNLKNLDSQNLKNVKPGDTIKGYKLQSVIQETGGLECFDVMDIGDCLTLFSVCDPVMCPVSRFNAGGSWKVDNVVSTGIFGSIFLGTKLWDFKRIPPEVGICIPGINAGLKNYRSVMEGYEQCLIARRDKGENVGICDTIRDIGVCKILWREGSSMIKLSGNLIDKALGLIKNKASGGGEYAYFQTNIQRTGEFLNFFTKEYATTYFSAYRGASTDEIGDELCKTAIYGKIPGRGSLLDQLTKPEGPPQFTGWFKEVPKSDLAGQLISDYEVYYHIYAGEDRDQIRYAIYLKDLDDLSRRKWVTRSTGYLNKGDFVDETVRLEDETGYDELCFIIDNKETCGFGIVSSDLVFDYFEDKSIEKQAKNKNIQSEQECIGESTIFNKPGASSVIDALYPGMLNNGLIRICSKENPGKGVNNQSWLEVGTCGKNNLNQELGKCWLSKQSYKDSLSVYDAKRREEAERLLSNLDLMEDQKIITKIKELIERRNSLKTQDIKRKEENYPETIKELNQLRKTYNIDLTAKIDYEIGETYFEIGIYLKNQEIKNTQDEGEIKEEKISNNNLKYKIIIVLGGDPLKLLEFLTPDIDYNWNGQKWMGKFGYLMNLPNIKNRDYTEINNYEEGLNKIDDVIASILNKKQNIISIELYCYENKKPDFTLEKKGISNNVKNWIDQKSKECLDESKTTKTSEDKEETKQEIYFAKFGGGFDVLFDKDNDNIDAKTKEEIELYLEENYDQIRISKNLEIISYVSNENDGLDLPKKRLDSILNILKNKPYNRYIKNLEIKSEARGEFSDYSFAQAMKDKEELGRRVQVRFIGIGNPTQSLFEGSFSVKKKNKCEECGNGLFNVCEANECHNLGESCYIKNNILSNSCNNCNNAKSCGDFNDDKDKCLSEQCGGKYICGWKENKCIEIKKPEIPINDPEPDIPKDLIIDEVTRLSLGEFNELMEKLNQLKKQLPPPPKDTTQIDININTIHYTSLYNILPLTEKIQKDILTIDYDGFTTAQADKLFVNNKQEIELIRQAFIEIPEPMPKPTPEEKPERIVSREGISSEDYKQLYERIKDMLYLIPLPPESKPTTCETRYPGNECVDTNKFYCADIHTGLCPGGNNIVCCKKGKEKKTLPKNFLREEFIKQQTKSSCSQYSCNNYDEECLWWDCKSQECTLSFNVEKILINYGNEEIIACGKDNKRISPLAYGEDSIPKGAIMEIKNWIGGYNQDCSIKGGATSIIYKNTKIPWGKEDEYFKFTNPETGKEFTEEDITSSDEEIIYNEKYENPYGPAYANLITAKKQNIRGKWYNKGLSLGYQLHGTTGQINDYDSQFRRNKFTHGCLRSSNRFIMWLRDHAKPGTLVYYINSNEGDSTECKNYKKTI